MATSTFEQQSARRKFIYFGLILLLFTGSLLHRKFVVNAEANELMLRDVNRGKADLTDSASRLVLSGARGVAVTSLWLTAIKHQSRHEWNEMELAVSSLTHLQPHFISPWLFQGWNLSFNVAVECDRMRDKYYYVSRGINLLSKGEEKNDPGQAEPPQPWPASPKLRFEIANAYHRKIGQSDENRIMRCLFDLSCIPPSERNPERYYQSGPQGKQLDLVKFKQFCENHPRLVRRLRERLSGYEKPEAVVQFLNENKDIPSRFEERSHLKENDPRRLAEFPILPPQNVKALNICSYPDWRNENLASSGEDFDIFACFRAWYTYAQVPLPEPETDNDPTKFDRTKYRRAPFTSAIFRLYPARAQGFFAEELQKDGWFDDSGWAVPGWFDSLSPATITVGAGSSKYHSGEAWNKAHGLAHVYAQREGFGLDPQHIKRIKDLSTGQPSSEGASEFQLRAVANFDDFYQQTRVEAKPETVAARKAIFEVEHTAAADLNVVNIYRETVLPQWLDLLLRNPEFRKISYIQEESYELQAKLFKELQNRDFRYKILLENMVKETAFAGMTCWPTWPFPGAVPALTVATGASEDNIAQKTLKQLIEKKGLKVFPIKDVEGQFDQLFLLDRAEAEAIKPAAMILARQALWPPLPDDPQVPDIAFARFVIWPTAKGPAGRNPEIGLGQQSVWPPPKTNVSPEGSATATPIVMMLSSAEQRLILTQIASQRNPPSGLGWTPLIPPQSVQQGKSFVRWMQ